jgi:hypothetical protein
MVRIIHFSAETGAQPPEGRLEKDKAELMGAADLDAIRTMLREELAPIRNQSARIEEKLRLLPDPLFLYDLATAQEVVQALRRMAAKPPQPHEGLMVPQGEPGRLRRPT